MSRDYPVQSYFPLCKARLTLRFDEFGGDPQITPPKKPSTMRKGQKDKGEVLDYELDPTAEGDTKRYVLKGKGSSTTQAQKASKDQRTQSIEGIIPASATLERNSFKEADTLDLAIPFLDLPFEPRTIRACAIELYMGTIDEEEWGEYMRLQTLPLLPDESDIGSNKRFEGWVDNWDVNWDEGIGMVNLTCRDNTALLIDEEAPPQLKVDPKVGIDEAIAKYLSNFPQFEGLSVEYRPNTEDAPMLKDVMQVPGKKNNGAGPGKEKSTVWDYIYELTGMVGCVAFVDGTTVVIQKPRTLLAKGFRRTGDPWKGREAGNLNMPNRTYIYGRNLDSFGVSRQLSKKAPVNIEVRCYLPERKKTLVARFPAKLTKAQPGQGGDNTIVVHRVQGVNTKEALLIVAQSLYEQIGRQELVVRMKSFALASFGGGNTEPDALWLQSGDPVDVFFAKDDTGDPVPLPADIAQIESTLLAKEKAAEFLESLGYSTELSKAYAEAYVDSGFQTTYRVLRAQFTWTNEEGITISIDGMNYVEVRADGVLPEELEPQPVDMELGDL